MKYNALVWLSLLLGSSFAGSAQLRVIRTPSKQVKGTVLLLPGGVYEMDRIKSDGLAEAKVINKQGFNAALIDYQTPNGKDPRDQALREVLKALKILRTNRDKKAGKHALVVLKGIGAGAHLAAMALQFMDENEQPDSVHLVDPSYLNEKISGTVLPSVLPPIHPKAKLHVSFTSTSNQAWKESAIEYQKTWKGYEPLIGANPAAASIEGYSTTRHNAKLQETAKENTI